MLSIPDRIIESRTWILTRWSRILAGPTWILSSRSWILAGRSRILAGRSWILAGLSRVLARWTWILASRSWILTSQSRILARRSRILATRRWILAGSIGFPAGRSARFPEGACPTAPHTLLLSSLLFPHSLQRTNCRRSGRRIRIPDRIPEYTRRLH